MKRESFVDKLKWAFLKFKDTTERWVSEVLLSRENSLDLMSWIAGWVFWRKLMFTLLFISILVNTAFVSTILVLMYFEKDNISFIFPFLFGKYRLQSRYFFNTPRTLKNMDVSFIVYLCLDKYSFSFETFSIHLVFWSKWTFHSLFICVLWIQLQPRDFLTIPLILNKMNVSFIVHLCLVNTTSISGLFDHSSYFKENERFIHCLFVSCEYSFSLETFWPFLLFQSKWTFHSLFICALWIQLQSRDFLTIPLILNKMIVSFIVHFCLGKYSFGLDTFSTHLEFWSHLEIFPFFLNKIIFSKYLLLTLNQNTSSICV